MGSSDYVPQVNDHVTYITAGGKRKPATITAVTDVNTVNLRLGHYGTKTAVQRAAGWAATDCWERTRPGAAGTAKLGGVASGQHYLSLPGNNQQWAATGDAAVLDVTGDIELWAGINATDWTPAADSAIISKWETSTGQRSYWFGLEATTGKLKIQWSDTGSTVNSAVSTVAPTVSDGNFLWVRATLDVNNGAVGRDIKFYTSTDALTTAVGSVTWTQLGSTVTQAVITSIFNGNSGVVLGGRGTTTFGDPLTGRFYIGLIKNGLGGSNAGSPDFRTATPGAGSITDGQSTVWTVQTGASIN